MWLNLEQGALLVLREEHGAHEPAFHSARQLRLNLGRMQLAPPRHLVYQVVHSRKLMHFSHYMDGKVQHDQDKVDKISRESAKTGMANRKPVEFRHALDRYLEHDADKIEKLSRISFDEGTKTADYLENAQSCQGAHSEAARQPVWWPGYFGGAVPIFSTQQCEIQLEVVVNSVFMDARKLLHFSHFVDGKVEHDHDKVDKITRESAKTGMTATRINDSSFSISFDEGTKTADYLENAQSCQGAHSEAARQPAKVSEHHRKIHLHFKHHTTVNDDKTTKTTTEVVVECLEDILEIARKAVIWLVDKLFTIDKETKEKKTTTEIIAECLDDVVVLAKKIVFWAIERLLKM
ncbi:hypothetical protein HPB52_003242 [Rhipicephalus sanguineus]|uniref:Uncharacterized protein n=1 Tax=Rhipicephalus sanguineus TaxID=34632 RepID=A0A9D4QD28_RHISA|nr:hypothetical protein HPB52_003242 [Rhipicephalus sanguineus]